MNPAKSVLVVGGGLAGSTLAVTLIKRGMDVTVVSSPQKPAATRVAAGVFNPVVLKRLTLTNHASAALKKAHAFYSELQNEWKQSFHFTYPMVRIFENAGECNEFMRLTASAGFKEHIAEYHQPLPTVVHAPYGCGIVHTAGRVDTQVYLNACYKYVLTHGKWIEHTLQEKDVELRSGNPVFNGQTYDAVVFCEGYWIQENGLWSMLRFKSVSGEVLDVEIPGLPEDTTWHVGVYATPLGNHIFRVGATYLHENTQGLTTFEGRKELLDKLQSGIRSEMRVVNHLAGVRPAAHDRNPYLGRHPLAKNVYVFNGLGSRGVLLAPYGAEILSHYMFSNGPLPYEWSVLRVLKK